MGSALEIKLIEHWPTIESAIKAVLKSKGDSRDISKLAWAMSDLEAKP